MGAGSGDETAVCFARLSRLHAAARLQTLLFYTGRQPYPTYSTILQHIVYVRTSSLVADPVEEMAGAAGRRAGVCCTVCGTAATHIMSREDTRGREEVRRGEVSGRSQQGRETIV